MLKIYLLCVSFLTLSLNAFSQVLESDSSALVDFYNSTNGNSWFNKDNWLNGPVSTWHGITVTGNRVTGINLDNNNLSGTLNPSIGDLSALKFLDLIENYSIAGNIPEEIGDLTNLEHLSLGLNGFTGTIPESLSNLVNLKFLDLEQNFFTGEIPASLGNLTQIEDFVLNGNQLTGSVPASLGNFQNLGFFFINRNQLSGPFPSTLCNKGIMMIDNNQFTFEGLECLNYYAEAYTDQKTLDITNHGASLAVSAGGTLGNNTYYWYKDGVLYQTKPADSVLQLTEIGEYRVEVTNSVLPALTLNSHPIIVSSILPLEFISVQASICQADICLNWSTEAELNTSHFEIERAGSATEKFTGIGKVAAANRAGVNHYSFKDQQSLPGTAYYRIKQVDLDGRSAYSKVVKVDHQSTSTHIYPNPANSYIIIEGLKKAESVTLINMAGQIIRKWQTVPIGGKLMLGGIPAGLYVIVINERDRQTKLKLLIE